MNNSFRHNIATTFANMRFPLMIGVVMIHCAIYDSGSVLMENVNRLFSVVLPVFCVPVFFFISGYFFFANVKDFSIQIYKEKVSRRIRTLLVPYLCANLFMILCYASIHYFAPNYINPDNFNILQYSIKDFIRAFWSVGGFPICYPTWYIRNLFLIVLCSPLFYLLIKQNIKIKLSVLIILAILRFFFDVSFMMGPIYFYIGALFSRDDVCLFIQRLNNKYVYIVLGGAALISGYLNFIELDQCFVKVQRFTMSILILRLSYLLFKNKDQINNIAWNSSFFLFLYHAFPIFIIKKILYMAFDPTDSAAFVAMYILLIISTIMICVMAYYILNKFVPSLLSVLTGGRNRS